MTPVCQFLELHIYIDYIVIPTQNLLNDYFNYSRVPQNDFAANITNGLTRFWQSENIRVYSDSSYLITTQT